MPFNTPFDSKDFATLTDDLLQSLRSGEGGRPVLTDDTEGSVVRTLAEAFARELAVCYLQLKKVYQHGFLDTAEGIALDNVVALLGIDRQRAGHIEGSVTFSRPQPAPDDIPIPSSIQVAGRKVVVFETVESAIMRKDTQQVTVRVRSVEASSETVKAGALNLLPRPIWGIDTVINNADLLPIQREETDAELRDRARHIFQKTNLGTTVAIEQTIRALGISQVVVHEDTQKSGVVDVILGDTDISNELLEQVKKSIQEVRPAGIRVNVLLSNQVLVSVTATLILREEATTEQKKNITAQITSALQNYFNSLKTGELVHLTKINAILTAPDEVISLIAPEQGKGKILRTFNNQLINIDSSHISNNGDVRIESIERAILDLNRLPLQLSLEPPIVDVWLDVTITDPQLPGQFVLDELQVKLSDLKEGVISYQNLMDVATQCKLNAVQFRLIHSQTNLTTLLNKAADSDQLRQREQLRVGRINVAKGD